MSTWRFALDEAGTTEDAGATGQRPKGAACWCPFYAVAPMAERAS